MPNDTPDARLSLQEAFQAATNAHLHLFMVLDSAMSYGGLETFRIPTDVLLALDASREAEAALFQYLEPGITSAQTERAWKHAVEAAEAMTGNALHHESTERHADGSATFTFLVGGLTQDQEPMTIEQQYENGLLSLGEYQHLVEAADVRNTVAWITEKLS